MASKEIIRLPGALVHVVSNKMVDITQIPEDVFIFLIQWYHPNKLELKGEKNLNVFFHSGRTHFTSVEIAAPDNSELYKFYQLYMR